MTCYMRHMKPLFETLGLTYDEPNRQAVDRAIRAMLGLGDTPRCPEVWAAIKTMPEAERQKLPERVAEQLGKR
jgi:hypothetical protein